MHAVTMGIPCKILQNAPEVTSLFSLFSELFLKIGLYCCFVTVLALREEDEHIDIGFAVSPVPANGGQTQKVFSNIE